MSENQSTRVPLTPQSILHWQKNRPEGIDQLSKRSTMRGLLAIFANWLCIAGFIFADQALNIIWLTPIFIWWIGGRHYAMLEGLMHNAAHHTLFAKRDLHYQLAWLYCWPFGYDVAIYRKDHLRHHRHFLTAEDGECHNLAEHGLGIGNGSNLFWKFWVRPFLGYATFRHAGADWISSPKVGLFWLGMLAVTISTGTFWWFALYHLIPRFYVFAILFYWSDIQDHYRTHTGTRVQTGFLANFLTHNEGFHSFHHIYPQVPWFNVPQGHALVDHDFDESTSLFDSYRQMRDWNPPGNFPQCF